MRGLRARLAEGWARPVTRMLRAPAVVLGSCAVALRLIRAAADGGGDRGLLVALLVLAGASFVVVPAAVRRAALTRTVPTGQAPVVVAIVGGVAVAGAVVLGAPVLAALERRYGPLWAAALLAVAAAIVGLRTRHALDRLSASRPAASVSSGDAADRLDGAAPILEVDGVDFGYGPLQVLHGISLQVGAGELVALLGVNGAGKSTVLRAISGLGLPSAGTIRFSGEDITYLDAETRVRKGIVQVPGGRAVFGSLSVIDNLRAYAYSLPKADVDAVIDEVLRTFPRLAERREQDAATLSGGEQQMLALAKALMLRPRLLLIDELSLGLAPVIVGQLLELVREINAGGTAVVLVEQSVNIALELAEHAFFLERGAVQFDGPSSDLRGRDDLLRAVFLEGTAR